MSEKPKPYTVPQTVTISADSLLTLLDAYQQMADQVWDNEFNDSDSAAWYTEVERSVSRTLASEGITIRSDEVDNDLGTPVWSVSVEQGPVELAQVIDADGRPVTGVGLWPDVVADAREQFDDEEFVALRLEVHRFPKEYADSASRWEHTEVYDAVIADDGSLIFGARGSER